MRSVIAEWHGKKYAATVNEYGVAVFRDSAEQVTQAGQILSDPGAYGGVDGELFVWAQEAIERLRGAKTSARF